VSFIKIWGCETYVKRLMSDKLGPRSDKCIFVGYPKETKGYYFYYMSENKIVVARHAIFLEKEFLARGSSGSNVQLEEIQITHESDVGGDFTIPLWMLRLVGVGLPNLVLMVMRTWFKIRLHKMLWKKHLRLMHFACHQDQVIHLKDDWDFIKDRHVTLRIL
jgi:hypothetical protein